MIGQGKIAVLSTVPRAKPAEIEFWKNLIRYARLDIPIAPLLREPWKTIRAIQVNASASRKEHEQPR